MRRMLAVLAVALPTAAPAQSPSLITATPLPPLSFPQGAATPDPTQATQPQAAPDATPAVPQPMQLTWVPQNTAELQVLDKVNAQNAVLTVKVGQQAQYGSLTIQVQACSIHPADQPQDSAAYLAITDSHTDAPGFKGWMLANDPAVSMLQNPIYDVRVVGCRT